MRELNTRLFSDCLSTDKMAAGRSRFASLNDEEFDDLLNRKDSENTQKATKKAVTVFREYLSAKNRPEDFENFEKDELGNVLSRFYVEARRSDGIHYKTSSLNGVRAGLNRHLKQNYYLGSGTIDIIRDKDFVAANMAFRAAIVELKKIGKGDVQHHQAIDENDIAKLYRSGVFDQNSPTGLQLKVWFELMLYICRRGRENLRELKKDHFVVATDSDGRQYVTQAVDELTKKTREDNQYQQYLHRTLAQLLLAAQHVVQCKFSLCNSRVHFRYIIVMSPLITTII